MLAYHSPAVLGSAATFEILAYVCNVPFGSALDQVAQPSALLYTFPPAVPTSSVPAETTTVRVLMSVSPVVPQAAQVAPPSALFSSPVPCTAA